MSSALISNYLRRRQNSPHFLVWCDNVDALPQPGPSSALFCPSHIGRQPSPARQPTSRPARQTDAGKKEAETGGKMPMPDVKTTVTLAAGSSLFGLMARALGKLARHIFLLHFTCSVQYAQSVQVPRSSSISLSEHRRRPAEEGGDCCHCSISPGVII